MTEEDHSNISLIYNQDLSAEDNGISVVEIILIFKMGKQNVNGQLE